MLTAYEPLTKTLTKWQHFRIFKGWFVRPSSSFSIQFSSSKSPNKAPGLPRHCTMTEVDCLCAVWAMQRSYKYRKNGLFRWNFSVHKYKFLVLLFFPFFSRERLAANSHASMCSLPWHRWLQHCTFHPHILLTNTSAFDFGTTKAVDAPSSLGHQWAALQHGNTRVSAHKELFLTEKRASCRIFLTWLEMKVCVC